LSVTKNQLVAAHDGDKSTTCFEDLGTVLENAATRCSEVHITRPLTQHKLDFGRCGYCIVGKSWTL